MITLIINAFIILFENVFDWTIFIIIYYDFISEYYLI